MPAGCRISLNSVHKSHARRREDEAFSTLHAHVLYLAFGKRCDRGGGHPAEIPACARHLPRLPPLRGARRAGRAALLRRENCAAVTGDGEVLDATINRAPHAVGLPKVGARAMILGVNRFFITSG